MPSAPPPQAVKTPPLRTLQYVAAALLEARPRWQALGVTRVRIFGSVARGEATDLSDVDLLVDMRPGSGLLDLMAAKALFEDLLQPRTDVITEAALKAPLRRDILADAIDVEDWPMHAARHHRHKTWRWRVYDLLDAADRIKTYTAPHTAASFAADPGAVDAVLRNLARLGETTKFIPQSEESRHPEVPWAYLRDIRNLVAHDYFGIDLALTWETATRELPALRPKLQAIAEGKSEENGPSPQPPVKPKEETKRPKPATRLKIRRQKPAKPH